MKKAETIVLFMCGDVMIGRGIDHVLPHPSNPILYEPYVKKAEEYVRLAEAVNGSIPKAVDFSYIWGDALDELERVAPDLRIVNLETAITKSDEYLDKGINYRMNPKNIPCLTAAKIDFCSLANNHVLDWGYSGLVETLETLRKRDIKNAGAGRNREEAEAPAALQVEGKGRVIVFSYASETSGVPSDWAATQDRPGVNYLKDLSRKTVLNIKEKVDKTKQGGDIVVASIHWGSNWGYAIPNGQMEFAHALIENAGVDIIHGHSSHHVKGIEVYRGKLVLYGCGDFLNDYEGISGYEAFRNDLGLMYFASVEPSTGNVISLEITPTQIKRFRINRASNKDAIWLRDVLNKEGARFGTRAKLSENNTLTLEWT